MAEDKKSLELQIKIATREALKAVSSLKGEIKTLAAEANKFAREDSEALKKSFKDAEKAAKETTLGIGEITKGLKNLAEVVVAAKALSFIKDMGSFALKTADDFQTMRSQFGILLGDMQAGAGLFNEIKAFNDKTPFDMETLTQATNVLIAAKVPLSELQDQLTKFGDLSQGNSQRMTSYVNAFSQAAAKGKADMQVLNTYLNQGVPILDALAKNFNVTTAEIVEMSSKGQISFRDFSKALDDLTAAGGQYFGGMELASESLAAMKEGLQESVNSLAASFGDMLMPAAISVVEILGAMTDAINENPLLKGAFAGALVAITGLLAAKAVKASIAFAAQMKLNFAIGALNPAVLASTIAVAGLAAGYTATASLAQKKARETENLALEQRKLNNEMRGGVQTLEDYRNSIRNFSTEELLQEITNMEAGISRVMSNTNVRHISLERFRELEKEFAERRGDFINEFYNETGNDKIRELQNTVKIAEIFLRNINDEINFSMETGRDFSAEENQKNKLLEIIGMTQKEINRLAGDIDNVAARWKEAWADVWASFQAGQSIDPFANIELERGKKLADAWNNYVRNGNEEIIDQVNAYYDAQRSEVIKRLANEEERIQRELSGSKIAALKYELEEALKAIDTLEAQRIIAAANSEEEIQAVRERFAAMREDTVYKFKIEIDKTELEEARAAVKDWQQELSNYFALALMNIEDFSAAAAVIIGDLTAQLISLSASAALSGFEEFGRALGQGKEDAESLQRALAAMAQQILQQLPMMFLQAGLQLIANGQWALGLGFVAAAASSAIISGYADGRPAREADKHAQGGVFDEYGKAASRAARYAAGGAFTSGAFTNQIVSEPTYFRYGGALGLMGEAGPEAIMPLTRMPSGNLGVETKGGNTNVVVNVINNSGAEVQKEESTDSEGNKQIDVIIGGIVNNHITSGKADRAMGRYGLRAMGV